MEIPSNNSKQRRATPSEGTTAVASTAGERCRGDGRIACWSSGAPLFLPNRWVGGAFAVLLVAGSLAVVGATAGASLFGYRGVV